MKFIETSVKFNIFVEQFKLYTNKNYSITVTRI